MVPTCHSNKISVINGLEWFSKSDSTRWLMSDSKVLPWFFFYRLIKKKQFIKVICEAYTTAHTELCAWNTGTHSNKIKSEETPYNTDAHPNFFQLLPLFMTLSKCIATSGKLVSKQTELPPWDGG